MGINVQVLDRYAELTALEGRLLTLQENLTWMEKLKVIAMGTKNAMEFIDIVIESGNTVKRALADLEAQTIFAEIGAERPVLKISQEEQALIDELLQELGVENILSKKEIQGLQGRPLALIEDELVRIIRKKTTFISGHWKNRNLWTRFPRLKRLTVQ